MDKATIIRTALLILALGNQVLTVMGYSPLPIDEAVLENLISTTFVVVMAVISWWKNTAVTKEAKIADAEMKKAKADKAVAKATGGSPVVEVDESENNGNI